MTDRVDPAVQGVQGPPLEPDLDRPRPSAGRKELRPPHNPMLSAPELRQEPIDAIRTAFAPYGGVNAVRVPCASVGHAAMLSDADAWVAR